MIKGTKQIKKIEFVLSLLSIFIILKDKSKDRSRFLRFAAE